MTKLRSIWSNSKIKKAFGIILMLLGLAALLTPFTPGSWLIFIGLELLGLRNIFADQLKKFWKHK